MARNRWNTGVTDHGRARCGKRDWNPGRHSGWDSRTGQPKCSTGKEEVWEAERKWAPRLDDPARDVVADVQGARRPKVGGELTVCGRPDRSHVRTAIAAAESTPSPEA